MSNEEDLGAAAAPSQGSTFLRRLVDAEHPLKDVALLVRRAGVEHLVTDLTAAELCALADAGDELAMERTAYFLKALGDPGEAMKPFDGGATLRAQTKQIAKRLSRQGA